MKRLCPLQTKCVNNAGARPAAIQWGLGVPSEWSQNHLWPSHLAWLQGVSCKAWQPQHEKGLWSSGQQWPRNRYRKAACSKPGSEKAQPSSSKGLPCSETVAYGAGWKSGARCQYAAGSPASSLLHGAKGHPNACRCQQWVPGRNHGPQRQGKVWAKVGQTTACEMLFALCRAWRTWFRSSRG